MIPIRLYAYAAAGLALAALIAFATIEHKRANAASARAEAYEAKVVEVREQLIAEREAREHEKEIANAASNQFQQELAKARRAAVARPLEPVRVCLTKRELPAAAAATLAAGGRDAAPGGDGPREAAEDPGPDLSAALTQFALDCASNEAQVRALQKWIRDR